LRAQQRIKSNHGKLGFHHDQYGFRMVSCDDVEVGCSCGGAAVAASVAVGVMVSRPEKVRTKKIARRHDVQTDGRKHLQEFAQATDERAFNKLAELVGEGTDGWSGRVER